MAMRKEFEEMKEQTDGGGEGPHVKTSGRDHFQVFSCTFHQTRIICKEEFTTADEGNKIITFPFGTKCLMEVFVMSHL